MDKSSKNSRSPDARRNDQSNSRTDSRRGREGRHEYDLPFRAYGEFMPRQEKPASPRRHGPPAGEATAQRKRAKFVDLPNEMVDKVVHYMDIRSVCNLRETSKHFKPSCNEYLQKHLTVLYLHPTLKSMKNLLKICANELFAKSVIELCLLGDPMWDIITKEFPTYRQDQIEDRLPPNSPREWWHLNDGERFKAWPKKYGPFKSAQSPVPMPSQEAGGSRSKGKRALLEFPKDMPERPVSQKRTPKKQQSPTLSNAQTKDKQPQDHPVGTDANTDFETCYKLLIDALAKLESLCILSYQTAPKIQAPGWNAVSPEQIRSHAHAKAALPTAYATSPRRTVSGPWSDADVLYRLLASPRLKFSRLNMGSELPLYEDVAQAIPHIQSSLLPDLSNPFLFAMNNLKQLEISIDCGWEESESVIMYYRLIRGSANSLESLRIRLISTAVIHPPHDCEVVECLLLGDRKDDVGKPDRTPVMMPNLKQLEIFFVDRAGAEGISRHRSGRWRRPPLVTLMINRFWETYLPTLTSLRFDHIVNWNASQWGLQGPYSIPQTIKADLQFLKSYPHKLQQFDWIVPAFRHHPLCKASDDAEPSRDPPCERLNCGIYRDKPHMSSSIRVLKAVADELGVALDQETDTWNFGDYIKPDIEARKAEERENA